MDLYARFAKGLMPAEPTDEQFRGRFRKLPVTRIGPKSTRGVRADPVPEPLIFGVDLGPVITTNSVTKTRFNNHLFIWGWAYYRDVFPKTKPHVTEFCTRITGANLLPNQAGGSTISFTQGDCKGHNCDDDQCRDYKDIVEIGENPN